jgi:large subunit ribosomal protein L7e
VNDIGKLQPLEDYIVYGYLSKRSVIELVHRRAFTHINGELQPLSDNLSVEKYLGDKGIICLNDLSDEIYGLGPNFDDAISILCPFKLSAPLGSYEKKILNNKDEMEMKGGYLCDEMDTFLQKIL